MKREMKIEKKEQIPRRFPVKSEETASGFIYIGIFSGCVRMLSLIHISAVDKVESMLRELGV